MIYTFYGYKGGVGRTLALVHAASLLASTREASGARVLVIDLDLEAPGSIENFFPPVNGALPERGFSELLQECLGGDHDAEWIRERIASDAYPAAKSLLVLGSGSRERASFLEASRLLPQAYETGFFEKFREACDAYEYVLVDSRTGLADIATAATILVGDVLVAAFRPNHANLGIGEIVSHFLDYNEWSKGDPRARIVPLMSPRPSHYSLESRQWAKRFETELFAPHEIIQVPFDPVLQVGEQLLIPPDSVCLSGYGGGVENLSTRDEIDLDAPVLGAYVALVDRLASFNTERDLVAALQAEETAYAHRRYGDGLTFLFQIIRREPLQRDHWRAILRYELFIRADPRLREDLKTFLDTSLGKGEQAVEHPHARAWAYILRATFFRIDSPGAAEEDCDRALANAPEDDQELLAMCWMMKARQRHLPDLALPRTPSQEESAAAHIENGYDTILTHLEAAMEGLGPSAHVYIARGDTLRAMNRWEEAANEYDKAANLADSPAEALTAAGRALEQIGRFGDALRRYRAATSYSLDRDLFRRLAYLFASLGHFTEAIEVVSRWMALRSLEQESYAALINIRLAQGEIDAAAGAIHEMEKKMFVTRSLRVALAIRQPNFEAGARIAEEDPSDVRAYMRCLALLGAGEHVAAVDAANLDGSPEDAPPVLLAAVLAGHPLVRHTIGRLQPDAAKYSAKWRVILTLAETLVNAGRGSERDVETYIEATTADPELSIYLRNQLEVRLAHDVCVAAPDRVAERVAAAMRRIFDAWEKIQPRPVSIYFPIRLDRVSARGLDVLPRSAVGSSR